MSDFGNYMTAQEKKRTAYAEYNYASKKLELAGIKERLAEIRSQHEPMAKLIKELGIDELYGEDYKKAQNILDRIATYVVCGNKNA